MLKRFFTLLVIAAVTATFANAQFKIGVRAGMNMTNFTMKDSNGDKVDGDMKSKFKPGFQIGAVFDFGLGESFALQPGILYSQQGGMMKYDDEAGKESKMKTNLNYLQVPINVQYKINLGGPKLLLQAGPYIGYGFGGKNKAWYDGEKIDLDTDMEDVWMGTKDEDNLKPFDFGLGFGAGLEFGALQVGLGYNLGLANIANNPEGDSSIKNQGMVLTLTYLFGF